MFAVHCSVVELIFSNFFLFFGAYFDTKIHSHGFAFPESQRVLFLIPHFLLINVQGYVYVWRQLLTALRPLLMSSSMFLTFFEVFLLLTLLTLCCFV